MHKRQRPIYDTDKSQKVWFTGFSLILAAQLALHVERILGSMTHLRDSLSYIKTPAAERNSAGQLYDHGGGLSTLCAAVRCAAAYRTLH